MNWTMLENELFKTLANFLSQDATLSQFLLSCSTHTIYIREQNYILIVYRKYEWKSFHHFSCLSASPSTHSHGSSPQKDLRWKKPALVSNLKWHPNLKTLIYAEDIFRNKRLSENLLWHVLSLHDLANWYFAQCDCGRDVCMWQYFGRRGYSTFLINSKRSVEETWPDIDDIGIPALIHQRATDPIKPPSLQQEQCAVSFGWTQIRPIAGPIRDQVVQLIDQWEREDVLDSWRAAS